MQDKPNQLPKEAWRVTPITTRVASAVSKTSSTRQFTIKRKAINMSDASRNSMRVVISTDELLYFTET
jgi:hypothetical protein